MSSIMRSRSGLMALSVMRDAPVLVKVANPSSQDRTPRGAIVLAMSPAAANYRASGLVLWREADVGARSPVPKHSFFLDRIGTSRRSSTSGLGMSCDVTTVDRLAGAGNESGRGA